MIEKSRAVGQLGSSLQAEVTLSANDRVQKVLGKLGNELRFVLITSGATVQAFTANGDGADFDVDVTVSAHEKCVRCWHYREDVGAHADDPELCGRCIENVNGSGELRYFA